MVFTTSYNFWAKTFFFKDDNNVFYFTLRLRQKPCKKDTDSTHSMLSSVGHWEFPSNMAGRFYCPCGCTSPKGSCKYFMSVGTFTDHMYMVHKRGVKFHENMSFVTSQLVKMVYHLLLLLVLLLLLLILVHLFNPLWHLLNFLQWLLHWLLLWLILQMLL